MSASIAADAASVAELVSYAKDTYGRVWKFVEAVRPQLDPRAASRALSWIGDRSVLDVFLAASVVVDEDGKWHWIPPPRPDLPVSKEAPGGVLVRVASAAGKSTERYIQLSSLLTSSTWIWPGVLTFDNATGFAKDKLKFADGTTRAVISLATTGSGTTELALKTTDGKVVTTVAIACRRWTSFFQGIGYQFCGQMS